MSKMGQEFEKNLDKAKYDLYYALRGMMDYAGYGELDVARTDQVQRDRVIAANKALAKVEGK